MMTSRKDTIWMHLIQYHIQQNEKRFPFCTLPRCVRRKGRRRTGIFPERASSTTRPCMENYKPTKGKTNIMEKQEAKGTPEYLLNIKLIKTAELKEQLLHVGFQIYIDKETINKRLFPMLNTHLVMNLRTTIQTCVHFKKPHEDMLRWVRHREGKITQGYIYALYIDRRHEVVVAEVRIGAGAPLYATLVHCRTETPYQDLKRMATLGQLGPRIPIDPVIPIAAVPYAETK